MIEHGTRVQRRPLVAAVVLSMLVVLSGCSYPDWANPIEWYRGVIGTAADDPTGDEPNTQNLAKGSQEPYPNLASVPAPPTNALSAADRDKLRASLTADRAHAKYVDNADQYAVTAPQAVAGPVATPSSPQTIATSQGAQTPPPTTTAAPGASNSPSVAPIRTPPSNTTRRRGGAGGSGTTGTTGTAARTGPQAPQESPLTSPTVGSIPQGDTPRPAPPPPPGVPQGAGRPGATPTQTAALPPAAVTRSPVPVSPAGPPGVAVTVGVVQFTGNSSRIEPSELQHIRDVAQMRQQSGGVIRVTAYSLNADGRDSAGSQLAGFDLALDRARAIALALTRAGVPARAVEIGATPAPPGTQGGTAELALQY